jgi:nitroreductase
MSTIIEALNWRYATKKFDPSKQLTAEQLDVLTESLRLSASSFGLQPWKFVVVSNPETKAQLRAAAWDQPQLTDASHIIVMTTRTPITPDTVAHHIENVATAKGIPVAALEGYTNMITGFLEGKTQEQLAGWAARQTYIALGTLLTVAAHEQIDACPMEGFDPKQFDEILGLPAMGLTSVVIAAVGFRSTEDENATAGKVRFPKSEVIIEL